MKNEKRNRKLMIDGKVATLALFEPEDYEDFHSGKVMDRNGVRSIKGNYCHRQPEHKELPPQVVDAFFSTNSPTVQKTIPTQSVGSFIMRTAYHHVIVPVAKNLRDGFVVPFLTDKGLGLLKSFFEWDPSIPIKAERILLEANNTRKTDDPEIVREEQRSGKTIRFPA